MKKILNEENVKKTLKILFIAQLLINFVGVSAPELSFDALWYHLPLARLMYERGWWEVIPGGLLYYSGLPSLSSYINYVLFMISDLLGLASPEILVKVFHFSMGVGSAGLIYKLIIRGAKEVYAWGGVVLWYSTLVVGWQSISSYVDLTRTFFVLVGVYFALWWSESEKVKYLNLSGLFMAFSYGVKIIAIVDVVALGIVIYLHRRKIDDLLRYGLWTLVMAIAFFIRNYLSGYHILYPLVSELGFLETSVDAKVTWYKSLFVLFLDPRYRVGPFMLGLVVYGAIKQVFVNQSFLLKILLVMTLFYVFLPLKGHGRYALSMLSILSVYISISYGRAMRYLGVFSAIAIFSGLVGVSYRALSNIKFVPYVLGYESKEEFLIRNLKFEFGDYWDVGGELERVVGESEYLVYGVHNTYYLPGNYYHISFSDDKCYRYVLVSGDVYIPENPYELVHENEINKSKLYKVECEP